jgi:hypothetical protein
LPSGPFLPMHLRRSPGVAAVGQNCREMFN